MAVERDKAYLAAGADCLHPITPRDPDTIGRLVRILAAPINVMSTSGRPAPPARSR
jgi:2-methylisocitrate lyase-like PEP mutase family enzyme